jgi:uncharacterized membrane protein YesL
VFHTDVAKVDRNVVVVMVCTRMLQVYVHNDSSVFQTYIASVFISILHMFHTYVTSVLSGYCICLLWVSSVFQVFFTSVSSVFFICCKCCIWMFQK